MDTLPLALPTLAWLAFALGGVFGVAAQRSNFCTMGAITDILIMGDWTRLRMWALAAAVSIAGTAWLQIAGLIDVHDSIYNGIRLPWLSHIVGGLLFGIGMTLASGCGAKTLVRLGSGNLKSLVVFVFLGLSAYMTLRGLLGAWRTAWLDPVALYLDTHQDIPSPSPPATSSTAAARGWPAPRWAPAASPCSACPAATSGGPPRSSAASPSAPASSPAGI